MNEEITVHNKKRRKVNRFKYVRSINLSEVVSLETYSVSWVRSASDQTKALIRVHIHKSHGEDILRRVPSSSLDRYRIDETKKMRCQTRAEDNSSAPQRSVHIRREI